MVLLGRVTPAIESRRLVRHPSAYSASLRASDRLTRRREGAEIRSAAEAGVSCDMADPFENCYKSAILR